MSEQRRTLSSDDGWLKASAGTLAARYDTLLLDLDGVVYLGNTPAPYAAQTLARVRTATRVAFVTNNASRTPAQVVAHLESVGVPATEADVVTSAQAAAHELAVRLPPGSRVLVLGADGLRQAVAEEGLTVVERATDEPEAVAQGLSRDQTYAEIAEAALAIRAGAWWVAANADATLPTERGMLPGAGAFVAALRTATGREPFIVGKPEPALHGEAVRRSAAESPLVVGDRLDTDIEGAVRAGAASLLVLTGVTDPAGLLAAPAARRPTYVAADLRGLERGAPEVQVFPDGGARCGSWLAVFAGGRAELAQDPRRIDRPGDDGCDALRALCAVQWPAADNGAVPSAGPQQGPPVARDRAAGRALATLGLG